MAWFLVRFGFAAASVKAMVDNPNDREVTARLLVESFGGRLHHYFFCFGEYDGVGILEFPDDQSAAAFSMKASATGGFSKFHTTPLMTAAEGAAAMHKAATTSSGFRPPNA